jgi:serine/threonine-protein kinase
MIIKVLDALEYAHNEHVIHQDIKPGNIIIEKRTQRPFLVDFGIAHSAITEADTSEYVLGTPLYMAPEQIFSSLPDLRSDIYSTGMVLYEALAGKLPVRSMKPDEMIKMKHDDPDSIFTSSPLQVSNSITPEIGSIIKKAINGKPDKRYQCCLEFKQALETTVTSLP